jgi:hypothetical protein
MNDGRLALQRNKLARPEARKYIIELRFGYGCLGQANGSEKYGGNS